MADLPMCSAASAGVRWFCFGDSEVAGLDTDGERLRVRFTAAHLEWASDFSRLPLVGYAPLEIICTQAVHISAHGDCFGRLHAGRIVEGSSHSARLALPYGATGELRLELEFANGSSCVIGCAGVSIALPPAESLQESLMC